MEILRAETNDFPHLKNADGQTNKNSSPSSSAASSTIDEDDDEDKSKPIEENSTQNREHLTKQFKDYEDRLVAHRNFLLYTQAFALKSEDRERLFTQNDEIFSRLSKEERDRFLTAAIYNQQQTNLYNFPSYPWPIPPPVPTTEQSATSAVVPAQQPPRSPNSDDSGNQSNSGDTTEWTFEEQFRQLYELSDEAKRKEFLDDLFAFMQKRGTPVNRIPIMAKHVLDLYELFRLVVSKGGLVEVINKKLWREITKGLNLPSSITSAAFTLRTQYMKYLYPYECEKLQLSSPGELQAAIEGNRREGRRPSYAFEYSSPPQIMPPPPPLSASSSSSTVTTNPFMHRSLDPNHGHAAMAAAAVLSNPFFLAAAAASSRDVNSHPSIDQSTSSIRMSSFDEHRLQLSSPINNNKFSTKRTLSPSSSSFLSKQALDEMNNISPIKKPTPIINHSRSNCFTSVTTNSSISKLKIIANENSPEKSVTLSIELNGINYQGTLYANGLQD